MQNKLPKLIDKHKICVICEGNEEYEYLKRLKALKVWDEQFEIIPDNAGGNGNIPARYQDRYQNGSYELVLIFCDTEKKPYEQYEDIKRKINEFHGIGEAANEVIMFGNPCTMQIITKHWTETLIKSPAKAVNAPLIEKYTGVKNYKGRADQIATVMEYVTAENYLDMLKRVCGLETRDTVVGSSNFGRFMEALGNGDAGWIDEINDELERC
ncbi:hypothetical protein SAMN02910358_01223 [Lachnospiraceae bacterium XBB1006]|nr:hypothetical protein SAMN02910358_01223 [Lachnospiraceae bacterium XBB1006]